MITQASTIRPPPPADSAALSHRQPGADGWAWQNPNLAENPYSDIHNDSWFTDTYPQPGPFTATAADVRVIEKFIFNDQTTGEPRFVFLGECPALDARPGRAPRHRPDRDVLPTDALRHPVRPVDGLEVFLISRINEEVVGERDVNESVTIGLGATGKIILSAGLIMTSVFLAFATNPSPVFKQLAFGLALAVAIDAHHPVGRRTGAAADLREVDMVAAEVARPTDPARQDRLGNPPIHRARPDPPPRPSASTLPTGDDMTSATRQRHRDSRGCRRGRQRLPSTRGDNMSTDTIPSDQKPTLWRSRWAAIGAAVAVSFGAGGFLVADAAGGSESSTVLIDPARIMDTRDAEGNVGLAGPFVSAVSQKLQVTGEVPTTDGPKTVVPDGATGVLMNVTAVNTTANGFISVRPGDATGAPATSSLNVTAGVTVPNAVQVALPTAGADAGKIDITFDALGVPGPTTDILVDVVGYFLEAGTGPQPADNGVDYTSDNVAALLKFEDPQSLIDLTIDAPKAGHVVLSAMVELVPTNAAEVGCTIVVDPTSLDGAHAVQVDFITNWNDTRGFAVPEGPTTFHIVCQQNSGNDDDVTVQTRNLTAVFSSAQL